jgi:hypothetical protein
MSAVIEEDKIQVEHQEPTHVLNQEKQFKDAAAEKGQGFSGYEDLSLFQTISKFKVATLICFAVTLSAATDGYQVMPRRDSVNEQLADGRADWDSRQYRGQPRLCQSVRQRDRLRGCQNHWGFRPWNLGSDRFGLPALGSSRNSIVSSYLCLSGFEDCVKLIVPVLLTGLVANGRNICT